MAKVFISHASKDKRFAIRLATDLRHMQHHVWLDEWKLNVGDSIVGSIQKGLEDADSVLVILSQNSVKSNWVECEWQSKYWAEINDKKIRVLPILLETCDIPTLLKHKMYADFRATSRYATGLVRLANALSPGADSSGLRHTHQDFVDITIDNWSELFRSSSSLDLVVMYAATWRNTYLKHIRDLLARPNGRLRIVLPDTQAMPDLLNIYAKRLNLQSGELAGRVEQAIKDFRELKRHGKVEIYTSAKYFNHAMYLFDRSAVFALYSFSPERHSTPAFIVEDGWYMHFMREEFEYLVTKDANTRQVFSSTGRNKADRSITHGRAPSRNNGRRL